MKKNSICLLLFIVCVFLTGCSNEEVGENATNNNGTDNQQKKQMSLDDEQRSNNMENSEEETTKQQEGKKRAVDPKYKITDIYSIVPMDDETNEKVVLLTFDDAPDKYALEMAETLKSLHANAIFFVNGHFLESTEKKKVLKKIYDMGFTIGNHTYSHAYLPDLSKEDQRKEIVRVNDMVEDIIGIRPKFFRAPNGANTDYSRKIAARERMVLMNWSYGYDWNKEYESKEAITDIMLHTNLLTNGANLLMHDRQWTAAALKDIVTGLRDQGYEIVDPKLIKTK